jgi:carbon-monoxide dehydrogenase large subunit
LVEGQLHGGIVQGLGQALYEGVVYDDNGQLRNGNLMEYAVPKAAGLPRLQLSRTETPTSVNPLGIKGIGEAGTIGSTPAVVNAVIDALAPFGVSHVDMPLTPQKIWRLCQGAKAAAAGGRR